MMIIRVHASYFFWQKPKMDPFRINVHAIIPQTCIKVTFLQTEKVTVKQISLSIYSFPFPPSIQLIHLYIKKNFHFISLVSCHHLIPWSLLWVYLFLCEIHRSYAILPLIVVLCVPYHRKKGGRFKLLRGIWRTYYYATTSVEHTSV